MSPTIEEQIEKLKSTVAEMEAQREALGDAVVQSAIAPLQQKLDDLTLLLSASQVRPFEEPVQKRKLLTILFIDIVGSTAMIQNLDPEDVGQLIDHNLKRLSQPITEYGGHITSFTGDGFMAIFGVPSSQEDDPERAVRAGLAVLQCAEVIAEDLKQDWGIESFNLRVGIHTGLVLLGGETQGPDTTKGPAVQLAARLQSAATPGGLLISHDTYRHIRGVFNVEACEPLKVKGFDIPVRAYRVLSAKPRAFRFYTRGVEGVETRMVGRHDELKYLQDAFLNAVEDHEGHVVTILGEAGLGKSRLLYEFENWIDLQPSQVWFYEGKAHQEALGMPLASLRDLFEFRFQLQESNTQEITREKVERGFCQVFGSSNEGQMRAHILGQWLGFNFSLSPHLKGMLADAEQLRNRGIMYLGEYFKLLGRQQAVVLFMEDIHWADDSSLDALNWLGERIQHQPLLIVCAARSSLLERRPYWGEGLAYHNCLALQPLSKRESQQLVGEILQLAHRVPAELSALIVEGAEGNPFYMEELVKMLVEDGVVVKGEEVWEIKTERLPAIKVPPTLAGVLQARLESLPLEEQRVLQQASVVGRLFWDQAVTHIQAAEGGRPQAVPQVLSSLRGREMVYHRETSTFAESQEYLFKHDLLREVTYESVLKKLRRRYHGLVADWLISQVGTRAQEFSGLIAGHLLQAGRKEEASSYFLTAGQVALDSFASSEAERYFRKALEGPLQDKNQAACLAGLSTALHRQGITTEAIEDMRRSIEIYKTLNDSDFVADLYQCLARMVWYEDFKGAWDICQEGLRSLEGAPESPGMARLLAELGRTAHFLEMSDEEVMSYFQRAIDMAERQGEEKARLDSIITIALRMSDRAQAIQRLEEAANYGEAKCLWEQASRAHNNLAVLSSSYDEQYNDLGLAYQHLLRTIEIDSFTGNCQSQYNSLDNMIYLLFDMGKLTTAEATMSALFTQSNLPQVKINELVNEMHIQLLYARGEWNQALEQSQQLDQQLDASPNDVFKVRFFLRVLISLELDRFKKMNDLKIVQESLNECMKSDWERSRHLLYQVIIESRRGSLGEAHRILQECLSDERAVELDYYRADRYKAETELAMAQGQWDAAISTCQKTIDIFQSGGYQWFWARTLIDLGDCYLQRGLPGDDDLAHVAFHQSLELFTEMGAPGYIRVLEERLGIALAKK